MIIDGVILIHGAALSTDVLRSEPPSLAWRIAERFALTLPFLVVAVVFVLALMRSVHA
jgi:hypothetical protein